MLPFSLPREAHVRMLYLKNNVMFVDSHVFFGYIVLSFAPSFPAVLTADTHFENIVFSKG